MNRAEALLVGKIQFNLSGPRQVLRSSLALRLSMGWRPSHIKSADTCRLRRPSGAKGLEKRMYLHLPALLSP
jgi:hypothetical protein